MKFRLLLTGIAIGVVPMLLLGPVVAQEGEGGGMGMQKPGWMKLTKEHTDLKKIAGDWTYTMKTWMAPGAPPMETTGTASSKLLWQGNYLEQHVGGNMMGRDWSGRLLLGYDTIDKQHVAVWYDSMSPVMSISYGTEKDGVITYEGMEADHMTGTKHKSKMTVKWDSDDQYTVTWYKVQADGTDQKSGELTYTRKAADAAKAAEGCGCGQ